MPGFWQKPICLHRHVTPIPTHSWSLFPLASQPHDLWKAHSFHLIPAILLVYVSYILLLHLNYIWDSPYLYCNVNSFLGLLTDSQGEFVFQAAFQVPQDVALPHRPFGTSAKPPSCAPLTDLWTHHTPFGVILCWAQESGAFRDDTAQGAPREVLLQDTLHTAFVLMLPLLLIKHSFQRGRWHPDLSQAVTGEFTVYLVFNSKVGEQVMAALFFERTAAFFFLYFFSSSKTLMSVLTHQLLTTDMYVVFSLYSMYL